MKSWYKPKRRNKSPIPSPIAVLNPTKNRFRFLISSTCKANRIKTIPNPITEQALAVWELISLNFISNTRNELFFKKFV